MTYEEQLRMEVKTLEDMKVRRGWRFERVLNQVRLDNLRDDEKLLHIKWSAIMTKIADEVMKGRL